jgi:Leucine-rich repeat (LRR) protein/AAA15 family ATPase/GTPase
MSILDYSNKGLTSIPVPQQNIQKNSLGQPIAVVQQPIQSLSLDNNKLTAIDDNIRFYSSIIILRAGNNQIHSISVHIKSLQQLQQLQLQNNKLTNLPNEFGNLVNLALLVLNNNGLITLPIKIGNLKKLTNLQLQNNQINALPARFVDLTALEQLQLQNNKLTTLPDEFGNLGNLTLLELNNNELTALPTTMGNLSALEQLQLQNNKLTDLPTELWQLSKLKLLSLWNNKLTSISEDIVNLQDLESLEIDNNQLTSLPIAVWQLPNLTTLGIGGNLFPEIPSEVWSLTKLSILFLHNSSLEILPPELGNLTALQELHLQDNKLTTLPKEIGNLTHLETLDLSNNQLTHLPSELKNLPNLKTLNLAGNPLLRLPEKPTDYTPQALIAYVLQHQDRITPFNLNNHKAYIFQNFSLAHLKESYTKELQTTFATWKLQYIDVKKVSQIDKYTTMVFILVTADVHEKEKLMFDLIKKCQVEGKEFFILLQSPQHITFADSNAAKGALVLEQHKALRNNYLDQIIEYENVQQISAIIKDRLEQRTPNVQLQNLVLKNIGHFEDISIDFDKRVTCIVGENGMGKTSILRALALSLIGTRHDDGKHTYSNRFVRKVQQLLRQYGIDKEKNILRPKKGSITLAYNIDGTPFKSHIELEYNQDSKEIYYDTNKTSEIVSYDSQQTTDYYLKSLVIGFPQTREVGVQNSSSKKRNPRANVTDIVPIITDQDDDRLNAFVHWIVNLYFLANKKSNELQTEIQETNDAVRQGELKKRLGKVKEYQIIDKAFEIISQIIGTNVFFKEVLTVDPPDLWVSTYDVREGIPVELLAQGFKELMGWVGYLVQRMAEAYPLYNNFTEQHAVVLIDEIDAFCHPKWQTHLLNKLLDAFPKVQFIITSHSPLVALDRDAHQIKELYSEDNRVLMRSNRESTAFSDLNTISLQYFGAKSILAPSLQGKVDEYYELKMADNTNDEEYQGLEQKLDKALVGLPIHDYRYLLFLKFLQEKGINPTQSVEKISMTDEEFAKFQAEYQKYL